MICAFENFTDNIQVFIPGGIKQKILELSGLLFKNYSYKIPKKSKFYFIKYSSRTKNSFENAVIHSAFKTKCDLFYTRSPYIAKAAVENSLPTLFESHVFSHDTSQTSIKDFIATINRSTCSGIVSISDAITQEYLAHGLRQDKIMTSPDGVNLSAFSSPEPGTLGRLFGSQVYERPCLVYAGSLSKEKGAGFFADCATRLETFNLVIVGGNEAEASTLRNAHRGCPNLFIHRSVPHKLVPALLQEAEMLVMPYLSRGKLVPYMSPLKLFEYLAAGRPIISSDLPVLRPILSDGHNCLFFQPESHDSFRAGVLRAAGMDRAQHEALKERQILTARQYSWTNRAKAIIAWHLGMNSYDTGGEK